MVRSIYHRWTVIATLTTTVPGILLMTLDVFQGLDRHIFFLVFFKWIYKSISKYIFKIECLNAL